MHIRSSLNASFTDLVGGESRWGDEVTVMMTVNETNEEKELQFVIEIEGRETEIDELVSGMRKGAGSYDQRELLEKYNYMQRRVVEIDR
jgi:hypothetical protein